MDILLFGGSFDPPHLGHIALLRSALRKMKPDEAYVIPAYRSPLKPGTHASAAERLKLARLAFKGLPVSVHPFELERGRPTYTYETLRFMKRLHPGARLTFLVGADAYANLDSWKRPAELRSACRWLAGPRTYASSSAARARLLAGEDVSRILPGGVLRRIRARGLYGLSIHRRLADELSPERYRHTVCVSRRALELSVRHGLAEEQAALAGLLHDCGRAVPMNRMAGYIRARRLKASFLKETAERNPILLHAYISEDLARRRFGVSDPEVLSAIRKHTLGDFRMSPLDRLIYVADACSADRSYPQARGIHRAALSDLDEAFFLAVRAKLEYALENGAWLHPSGTALWNRAVGSA